MKRCAAFLRHLRASVPHAKWRCGEKSAAFHFRRSLRGAGVTGVLAIPQYKEAETALKRARTEKMVLDWDFLPTPLR